MACNHKTAPLSEEFDRIVSMKRETSTLCKELSYQLHKHVYLLNPIGGRVHGAVGSHRRLL